MMTVRFRTGRKVGRTIYMQRGPEPRDSDELCGVMDSPRIAKMFVDAVNQVLDDAENTVFGNQRESDESTSKPMTPSDGYKETTDHCDSLHVDDSHEETVLKNAYREQVYREEPEK